MRPRLRLLTRPGCGLCEDFRQDWHAAFPGVDLPTEDVDRDALLRERFGDWVPVLIDGDDREVCRVRFDREACAAALAPPVGTGARQGAENV